MSGVVNKSILAVGHSHLAALRRGYRRGYQQNSAPPFNFSFMRLFDDAFKPDITEEDGVRKLNNVIPQTFEALVKRHNPDVIVSCATGNEYNFVALLNHPRRFDFYLPGRPDLPTDESAEILPVDLVEDLMRYRLRRLSLYLSAFAPRGGGRLIHMPPPPPISDNAYIASYPSHFGEYVGKFGISPKFFRMKMWLLTCGVLKKLCEETGVIFHPVPKSVGDAEGFLATTFWNQDPSHGNFEYGKIILDDIARTNFKRLVMESPSDRSPVHEPTESLLLAPHS
jgi:hypothetical protein